MRFSLYVYGPEQIGPRPARVAATLAAAKRLAKRLANKLQVLVLDKDECDPKKAVLVVGPDGEHYLEPRLTVVERKSGPEPVEVCVLRQADSEGPALCWDASRQMTYGVSPQQLYATFEEAKREAMRRVLGEIQDGYKLVEQWLRLLCELSVATAPRREC